MVTGFTQCLKDDSKMVRGEAVKMIGQYVSNNSVLLHKYFDVIMGCLEDKGTAACACSSVRRCCVIPWFAR